MWEVAQNSMQIPTKTGSLLGANQQHDLRHTWAAWHAQAGTPLNVVREMAGWKSKEMAQRYSHLSAAHLLVHAERIAKPQKEVAEGVSEAWSHFGHNEQLSRVVPIRKSLI